MGNDDDDATAAPFDDLERQADADEGASTIHHVDAVELRSLGIVAGLFYLTAFLVLALAIAGVYLLAASLGLISQVEEFMRSIGFRGFRFVGPEVILGFVLILAALVVFLTVMTLVAGAFYNLLGTGRHGIRIRITEVEPRLARRERRASRIDFDADSEAVAATEPLAEAPAAAAAVAVAPLAAAVDEETSVDDWVRAPEPAKARSKGQAKVEPPPRKAKEPKPEPEPEPELDEDDGAEPEEVAATPLVFEPVPDDAAAADGNGAGASKSATSSDDEPEKPEAVAG